MEAVVPGWTEHQDSSGGRCSGPAGALPLTGGQKADTSHTPADRPRGGAVIADKGESNRVLAFIRKGRRNTSPLSRRSHGGLRGLQSGPVNSP